MSIPPWFALPTSASQPLNSRVLDTPVIIVGSGLAGCHLAYALAQQNVSVVLLDAASKIAAGASANNAGIVKPFVTRSPSLADEFYRVAFNHFATLLQNNKELANSASFNACGVLQLLNKHYPPSNSYDNCTNIEASEIAGIKLSCAAIHFANAGWLDSSALCNALVQHNNIDVRLNKTVRSITQTKLGWQVVTESSNHKNTHSLNTLECHQLVLATGARLNNFAPTHELPITPARGQTSRFSIVDDNPIRTVITGKRYVIPDGNDVIVGASFMRDNSTCEIRQEEHEQNLEALKELLPGLNVLPVATAGFSGVRGTTPDRLPLVGPMPDLPRYQTDYHLLKNGLPAERFPQANYHAGLSVIGGFGSRGIVSAPYCAKLLADYLTNKGLSKQHSHPNEPEPSLADWSTLLHPGRFMIRALKRA